MTRGAAIAGVGLVPFGRYDDRTVIDLGREAVRRALTDSGIEPSRIQAAFCGTVYAGVAAGHRAITSLGVGGIPIIDVEAGCASGGAALRLAASSIRSEECDAVLVLGMEKMPHGVIDSSFFESWQKEGGYNSTPAYFALRARRLMRDSRVERRHLAAIAVKNRAFGVDNPFAMLRQSITIDEVLGGRLVCDPLTLPMLCSPNEGAAAVILRAAGAKGEVSIAAAALRSHRVGRVLGEHTPMSGVAEAESQPSPTELAARAAFEEAGLGPADLDLAEVQDTDAGRELLSYEELGLCERGGSAEWLDRGAPLRGGSLPVNLSGGLLSKGEPLGASALAQVIEVYWQLRGEAGARQVSGARVGLSHTVGRGANACVAILKR